MNLSQSSNDESKQGKRDAERAHIASFRDVPTLRKLIAAFEDDLRQSGGADKEKHSLGSSFSSRRALSE